MEEGRNGTFLFAGRAVCLIPIKRSELGRATSRLRFSPPEGVMPELYLIYFHCDDGRVTEFLLRGRSELAIERLDNREYIRLTLKELMGSMRPVEGRQGLLYKEESLLELFEKKTKEETR